MARASASALFEVVRLDDDPVYWDNVGAAQPMCSLRLLSRSPRVGE